MQVISAAQVRAGGDLIALGSRVLALRSGVAWATVKRFEEADGIPPNRAGTLERVKQALEAAGVRFVGNPLTSPGVRLAGSRKPAPRPTRVSD